MPNINDAFPSNYLKASDLKGDEKIVTIAGVDFEEVGRERERKAVVHFQGLDKGMVLNKTNARKITEIAGSAITEEWEGVQIRLYPTETEFGGETVECIRIKAVTKPKMSRMTKKEPDHAEPVDDREIPFAWLLPLALSLVPLTWMLA